MKNLNVTRKLLYDGSETEMPPKFIINTDSGEIKLTQSEIYGESFINLKDKVSAEDFTAIASGLTQIDFDGNPLFYVDDMQAYFSMKEDFVIVFSFGETQPGRYKLYFEDVWLKD